MMRNDDPPAWMTEDPPCEVCCKDVQDCICPECPVCGTAGDLICYAEPPVGHGLTLSPEQMQSAGEARMREQKRREQDDACAAEMAAWDEAAWEAQEERRRWMR